MSGCKMCVRVAVFEAYYFFLFLCILIFVLPFLIVPYLVYLSSLCHSFSFYFFFQAEDGIRYIGVDWSSDVCSSDLSRMRPPRWSSRTSSSPRSAATTYPTEGRPTTRRRSARSRRSSRARPSRC